MSSEIEEIEIDTGTVAVGDKFRVIREYRQLLGIADIGEEFEVVEINTTPSGPEAVVEYNGNARKYWFSPTTINEALGFADYEGAPDEPCLERLN